MNENSFNDIQGYRSLLKEIAELCEGASLTGMLNGGADRVAQRYNAVLERLSATGTVPQNLFSPLSPGVGYGEIGVEARMLAGYLRKEKTKEVSAGDPSVLVRLAPFVDSGDLSRLIREQREMGTPIDMETITHLAPFLGKEDLGQLLRGHLRPTPPDPPTPPSPPAPGARPEPQPSPQPEPPSQGEPTMRFPEAPAPPRNPEDRLGVLLERLKDPRLSENERADLIERVRSLTTG